MIVALVWAAHRVRLRIVEKHEREITALNERLMKAQEQERIRIAGELHDGVMQEMLAVTMMLGTAKRRIADDAEAKATIDKAQEKLIQVGTDIRQLSHDLHPPVLQEAGLPEAMRSYCEQFSASCGIPVVVRGRRRRPRSVARRGARALPDRSGSARERGEACARQQIAVRLTRAGDVVSLRSRTTASGFDASRLGTSGGLGLIMMRERATSTERDSSSSTARPDAARRSEWSFRFDEPVRPLARCASRGLRPW